MNLHKKKVKKVYSNLIVESLFMSNKHFINKIYDRLPKV